MKKLSYIVIILAGAVIITTTSCTRTVTKAAYNNANNLAYIYVNNIFRLNREQRDYVLIRLNRVHKWHRRVELPRYRSILLEIRERSIRGLTQGDVEWLFAQMRGLRTAFYRELEPEIIPFFQKLKPGQINRLEERLRRSNRDLEEEMEMESQERLEKRGEDLVSSLDRWFGSLTRDQEEAFLKRSLLLPDFTPVRLRLSRDRQREIVEAANMVYGNPKKLQALFQKWLLETEANWPGYYKEALVRWRSELTGFILFVFQNITKEQKEHFLEELATWIELAGELSLLKGDSML